MSAITKSLIDLPPRLLVGVSGGRDSVALWHALAQTGRTLILLHFDHGWRAESAEDARFVENLAQRHDSNFMTARAPDHLAKTESIARTARWDFFAQAAERTNCADLVLAHHADDQVETFLLQLLRGTGSRGSGMQPLHRVGMLRVHRPWLGIWRQEIETYAEAHRLAWREDATNADPHYLRNRLRHDLLPYLEKNYADDVRLKLWRTAEVQRSTQEWLDTLVQEESRAPSLSVARLRDLPIGRQRCLLHAWLRERGVPNISFADVEAARDLLRAGAPARANLSRNFHLRRQADLLLVEAPML